MVPNQFKHSWKPTKMTCHVSFGSRYQLDDDDIGTHIFEHIDQMMRQKILQQWRV